MKLERDFRFETADDSFPMHNSVAYKTTNKKINLTTYLSEQKMHLNQLSLKLKKYKV